MKKFIFISSVILLSYSCNNNPTGKLELYAEVPYAVGNIAYNHLGELVFSNHPFYNPEIRVMHYNPEIKSVSAFPNEDWNTPKEDENTYLSSVLGIRNDSKGIIWMLDMGFRNNITPKFVGWNTKTNSLDKIYHIPSPASLSSSQLNDFVIDEKHNVFIIADEQIGPEGDGSHAALVIVDMNTGKSRRVLEGHYSTIPEKIPLMFNSKPLNIPNTNDPLFVGADGITADKNNEWLYYCPLNGNKLYRIKIEHLLDENLSEQQLGEKVELYSKKENNGGLSIDENDNIYLTYLETNSIGVITKGNNKSYNYAYSQDLIWPDGISSNNDGYMYISAAQLQLADVFNNGDNKTKKPFLIFRLKPLEKGIFGR